MQLIAFLSEVLRFPLIVSLLEQALLVLARRLVWVSGRPLSWQLLGHFQDQAFLSPRRRHLIACAVFSSQLAEAFFLQIRAAHQSSHFQAGVWAFHLWVHQSVYSFALNSLGNQGVGVSPDLSCHLRLLLPTDHSVVFQLSRA